MRGGGQRGASSGAMMTFASEVSHVSGVVNWRVSR